MTSRVGLYRLYRLRRLIFVCVCGPVLVVAGIAMFKGPWALVLLALAIGLPLAHILKYPTAWMESVVVSITTAILLGLAGTIGPEIGLVGLALRLVGLVALGLALFFILSSVVPARMVAGTPRDFTTQTRRRTRLPMQEIKDAITLYPGRQDERVTCGEADEDGAFSVTIHQQVEALGSDTLQEFDIELFAQVLVSTPDAHEVMCVEAPAPDLQFEDMFPDPADQADPECIAQWEQIRAELEEDDTPPAVTVSRHSFRKTRRGGTIVDVAETGAQMTRGMAFGFWAQDYFADHLTDEMDRAEGRAPRANRGTSQSQLVVDMAKIFVRGEPVHPAE